MNRRGTRLVRWSNTKPWRTPRRGLHQPLHSRNGLCAISDVKAAPNAKITKSPRPVLLDRSAWLARQIAGLQVARFGMHWSEATLVEIIRAGDMAGFYHVALKPGSPPRLSGYVLFRTMADEGEILSLAVNSSRRRRGLAQTMMRRVLTAMSLSGVQGVYLEVAATNRAAARFYKHQGFVEVGRRKRYYQLPGAIRVDGLVMRRSVDSSLG